MPHPAAAPGAVTRRRVAALLAGGLVLGAGATATAATWNDPEQGAGSFRAGVFATQSQGGDGSWASHPAESPAVVTVTGVLAPGGTGDRPDAGPPVYAWINVRTTDASDLPGLVGLEAVDTAGPGALTPVLEYRVVQREVGQAPCTAADFAWAGAHFLAGGPARYQPVTETPAGTGGPVTVDRAGTGLCVEVRLTASAAGAEAGARYQGVASTLTFRFALTSTIPHGQEQP